MNLQKYQKTIAQEIVIFFKCVLLIVFLGIILSACTHNGINLSSNALKNAIHLEYANVNCVVSNIGTTESDQNIELLKSAKTDQQPALKNSDQTIIFIVILCLLIMFALRDNIVFILWNIGSKNKKLNNNILSLENLVKSHKKRVVFRARRRRINSRWSKFKRTFWGKNIISIAFSVIGWILFFIYLYHRSDSTFAFTDSLWKSLAYSPVIIIVGYILQRILKGAVQEMHHPIEKKDELV